MCDSTKVHVYSKFEFFEFLGSFSSSPGISSSSLPLLKGVKNKPWQYDGTRCNKKLASHLQNSPLLLMLTQSKG